MLSLTGEYALRAMIYLATHAQDWPIAGKEIAAHADVPSRYLSTILSALVRAGVLESTRGKSGGFRMVRRPEDTHLDEVLAPFESTGGKKRCPFGNRICSDANPCLAHEAWARVLESRQDFFRNTTVRDISFKKTGGAPTARAKKARAG